MKKKIFALILAAFTLTLCACGVKNVPPEPTENTSNTIDPKLSEYMPPNTGSTKTADATAATYATVSMTTDPNAAFEIPEPVNGTYACGCDNLFHGDYIISIENGVGITRGGKEISAEELVRGELIAMHYSGIDLETYPCQPVKVTRIEVLPEGAKAEDYETATCKVLRVSCVMSSTVFADEIKN
ncbi:MAG: hypothetical protein J6D11_04530 [Clostridia bacterium]|nr:hypothetical protein [Clostridia bacterium]